MPPSSGPVIEGTEGAQPALLRFTFLEEVLAVGRDYRMGLIAGSVLAAAALIWIATRPSLSPQPQLPPSTSGTADSAPALPRNIPAAPEVNQPKVEDLGRAQKSVPPVDLSGLEDRGKTESAPTARVHVVRPGETLSSISQQYYGSTNNWRKILAANEKTIKDANKIAPGTKLIIP